MGLKNLIFKKNKWTTYQKKEARKRNSVLKGTESLAGRSVESLGDTSAGATAMPIGE
jgi:hypothetical protein